MLPSLVLAFSAGLLVGSQIPYFPLSTFFARLLLALVCVAFEGFALRPVGHVRWCYGLTMLGGAGILYKGGQKDCTFKVTHDGFRHCCWKSRMSPYA